MSPDSLFQLASTAVLAGWLALALSPLAPRAADLVAAVILPLLLALAYSGLVLAYWSGAPGGFGSLPEVIALLSYPPTAVAGWIHFLAFDLFIGAWITRTARAERIPHLFVLPCLALTFLFGPAGFLTFSALRAIRLIRIRITGATL